MKMQCLQVRSFAGRFTVKTRFLLEITPITGLINTITWMSTRYEAAS
jgi:hypothetical protein